MTLKIILPQDYRIVEDERNKDNCMFKIMVQVDINLAHSVCDIPYTLKKQNHLGKLTKEKARLIAEKIKDALNQEPVILP
mgnify:CR=1 FL=1